MELDRNKIASAIYDVLGNGTGSVSSNIYVAADAVIEAIHAHNQEAVGEGQMETVEPWMLVIDYMTPVEFIRMWRTRPVEKGTLASAETEYCAKRLVELREDTRWAKWSREAGY